MPKISVITPAYQAASHLEKCVESVLAQDFSDWELILVDDGSTDATPALCDRLAATDPRVRVLHQENLGVSAARNNGMALAQGGLIAFLDADDWLAPNALGALYGLLTASGAETAACGNYLAWPDGHTVREAPPLPPGVYTSGQARDGVALPLLCDRLREGAVNGYAVRYLFDRSLIEAAGLRFSGAYLEDELFVIEYFAAGASLAVTGEPLYFYYQNPASVTRRYLPSFPGTFLASLARKEELAGRYRLAVTASWRDNACWAGLLMAVANEFARGNAASRREKRQSVRAVCAIPEFAHALACYKPEGMGRNKAVVAWLLRKKWIGALSLLYAVKNRG